MEKQVSTISERVNGKNVKIGDVEYLVPTLEELDVTGATIAEIKDGDETYRGYTNPKHQYLYDAVQAQVLSFLRGRLKPKSIEFKDGHVAWTTVEEILEPASLQRGGGMILRKQFAQAFNTFFATLGKSAKLAAQMSAFAAGPNNKVFPAASAKGKEIFLKYLTAFFAACTEDEQTKYADIIETLSNLCAESVEVIDE